MTLVAPGSAQLSAGSRRVGRFAIFAAICVVALDVVLLAMWLLWPKFVLWLFASTPVLPLTRWVLFALMIGWLALFVDAWRLGRPLTLRRHHRLRLSGLTAVLCVLTTTALIVSAGYVGSGHRLITDVFGDGSGEGIQDGRYNVLLLGGDAGRSRSGLRPDSITVASVDAKTGQSVLFGLPRNLQRVPFPAETVMHRQWPNGFDCGDECLLNAVYTWAESHKDLFPGVQRPGVEATRGAVQAVTGLEISYTVMIDLQGFRKLVDAVGGVTVDVEKKVALGGADSGPIYRWIEAGTQRMDGETALWFARSRRGSSDYERMVRQKCVLSAMLKQLDPGTVLTSFQDLASASAATVWTDVPATELNDLAKLAVRAKGKTPQTVNFVPPAVETSKPDFKRIRKMVADVVKAPERSGDLVSLAREKATTSDSGKASDPSTDSTQKTAKDTSEVGDNKGTVTAEEARPICLAP